ncbi:PAM68 family protein [Pseudanabaena sp. FACHB-1998]|uniref:photosystem II biosynthesis protein n=1 Tax=Pseudanabaena sp. FACHB-1998 TaxID=2692858 RepID=UPI0016800842|nr:PAM68 family protein [Pseudanabaena sp. FACHB-1998]
MSKPPERIPFEPNNRSKKAKGKEIKKTPTAPVTTNINSSKTNVTTNPSTKSAPKRNDPLGIPEEVNRRIVRRAALFCGVPTGMGITTFFVSYFVVTKHIFELPTTAVVLVSMLFLGLGVVGLSYGAISASWDEGRVGSWWGSEEFKKNFGYLTEAWKAQKKVVKEAQKSKS